MADHLKLFLDRRLNTKDHLEYIKGRLANMKFDDPTSYKTYSEFYGVGVDVNVTNEPEVKKKKGRPPSK